MDGHRPQVADVFRIFGAAYLAEHPASSDQRRVLRAVQSCKTAALGGHKSKCDQCGHEEFFYNSCRNRHCPKCQGSARAKWLTDRTSELLETPYFHVVFTLPDALGPIGLQNKSVLYAILFRAAAETLLEIASNPKHLGAQIGFLAVLHTWGQRLDHHPHVHCVVPGGGLSQDRSSWVSSSDSFFLPVRVLSRLFRGKFLAYLRGALEQGRLKFHGELIKLQEDSQWKAFLHGLSRIEWVVYAKPPFGGPLQVLKYLARYTHRVAISDQRLVSVKDGRVTFRYKDYRCGNTERTMTLNATEFIRRFLQHVLPGSFHRIRYYGFLSNRTRRQNVELARKLLASTGVVPSEPAPLPKDPSTQSVTLEPHSPKDPVCPACKKGHMVLVERIEPDSIAAEALPSSVGNDTS